jgi:hypothetical protein
MQDQDDIYTDSKQDEETPSPSAKEIADLFSNKLNVISSGEISSVSFGANDLEEITLFDDVRYAHAAANALNATYVSNIDPEHISEALQCLIALRNMCLSTRNGQTIFLTEESYNQLKNVIDKIFIK